MQKRFAWTLAFLAATVWAAAACDKRAPPSLPAHPITSVSDLMPGARVGVQRGTTGAFYAEDTLAPRGVQIVTFIKAPDMYNALEAGQIQAIINDLPISEDVVERKPVLKIVQRIDNGEKYAFAVHKENLALLQGIDQALENLFADGTYKAIFTKYFPRQQLPSHVEEATAVPFSGCPSLSTVQPRTLTVGSDIPYPPFEFFTESGEPTGFDVELIEAIAKELCLTPKWVNSNFDTIFTSLSAGRFDVVAAAVTAYAPEGSPSYGTVKARQKIVSFTKPYYSALQSLTVKASG
ncbi:transporter substrate-binding domain-containing protein [Polyangium mundeleinium]|uniref:Transporter substrate-binding domain-containing protein n=1 Tax=Polyangium mundeleinium TaxID=2995306 RepID=A0ABT5EMY1_9BACT|nr:transporter substrate-binding domain-containing protein [Polyangium mundeleinium]MDC0742839.1 transporter substrate-binding domain-containing protein [Polyangium mundeleinium]